MNNKCIGRAFSIPPKYKTPKKAATAMEPKPC
jgi:hypothetical protein